MMFLIRSGGKMPETALAQVKMVRKAPAIVQDAAGKTDYFCVGEAEAIAKLREAGWQVIELRDGWYADDGEGGLVIFGHGRYWEVRDTPFTVKEACGPGDASIGGAKTGEQVEVRRAIFGV